MDDFASDTEQAAFFEAGHAVGAWLEGIEVERLSIGWDGLGASIDVVEPNLPPTGMLREADDRKAAMALIRVMLSGPAAQDRYCFGACGDFASLRDALEQQVIWRAYNLARRLQSDRLMLPSLWNQVVQLLHREDTWMAVTALADAVIDRGDLDGPEIETIIHRALLGSAK